HLRAQLMALAHEGDAARRALVFRHLRRRNLTVSALRVIVPSAGTVLLFVLVAQIVVANLARGVSVEGIRIDRESLVVDAPSYRGTTEDGIDYAISARSASAPVSAAERLELAGIVVDISRPDG